MSELRRGSLPVPVWMWLCTDTDKNARTGNHLKITPTGETRGNSSRPILSEQVNSTGTDVQNFAHRIANLLRFPETDFTRYLFSLSYNPLHFDDSAK